MKEENILKIIQKLYLETSVWIFYFAADAPEKMYVTYQFFKIVKEGYYDIFISQIVLNEIDKAQKLKKDNLIQLIRE